MEVHGEDAVGSGGGEEVCDELCGDGVVGLGLAVLAGVAEIGNDGGDASGGGAAAGVDHNEELHQVVVDRITGGLDKKNVRAAHRFVKGNGDLSIGEVRYLHISQPDAHVAANVLRELSVGVAAEDLRILAV